MMIFSTQVCTRRMSRLFSEFLKSGSPPIDHHNPGISELALCYMPNQSAPLSSMSMSVRPAPVSQQADLASSIINDCERMCQEHILRSMHSHSSPSSSHRHSSPSGQLNPYHPLLRPFLIWAAVHMHRVPLPLPPNCRCLHHQPTAQAFH